MLLWNYQGYNHKESTNVDTSLAHFEGPKGLGSSNTLVIQDSFYYLTTLGSWLWRAPRGTWRLSHPFKGSSRDMPLHNLIDPDKTVFPDVWLNAGYLDGHVEKFRSTETKHVMNHGWEAWLTRKYK
jgi:prepilin-type processing-associated H-X9-DG protein